MKKILFMTLGVLGVFGLGILLAIIATLYSSKRGLYYSKITPVIIPTIEKAKERGVFYKTLLFLNKDTLKIDSLELVPWQAWLERKYIEKEKKVDLETFVLVIKFALSKRGKIFYPSGPSLLPGFTTSASPEYMFPHIQQETNYMYTVAWLDKQNLSDTLVIQNEKSIQAIKLVKAK
ncbi:hypothetical protein QNI16_03815 [Cytophagaceae bacterium YF14B1]|uniref:Uncharacterized protein n=1 Tax=Xanthocytophaga flava TaxID=3048013 RepID=A0AAE3U5J7_9BACT|nr:hypothetical protein [Xanthocytophaga flavus]MDJ1479597.1 hypothetical protein [Xanthocytophaga flavus]